MAARPSVLCALGFASLLVCGAGRAAAHDPPSGTGVYVRGDQLVVRTGRGLVVSRSPERRDFRFLCNEALGVAEFDVPNVLLQGDGSMLVGTSAGLVHVSPDLCTIDAMPAFGGARVSALVRASNESVDVYAATDAGFFASSDDAQTFSEEDASVFDSLELANDGVVYASGRYPGPPSQRRVYFARWQKGDALEQHELALEPAEVGVSLLGSDPRQPERVFAVAHAYLGTQYLDRFLSSSDGARSWTSPLSAAGIAAFTIDPATGTWLLGASTGLWRGRGDEEPALVRDAAVSCLAPARAGLYVCDGIGAEGGLSLSADGGESWTTMFRFNQVSGLSECPAESKAVQECQVAWADWTLEMPPGPPLVGVDAGAIEPPEQQSMLPAARAASSCAAVSGTPSKNLSAPWSLLLLVAACRKRRQRSSNQSKHA